MSFFPSIRTIYFSAIIIGFLPTIFQRLPGPVHARLQALLPPSLVVSNARPKVYCYDSITTFDNDNTTQKCLAVYPNGTFGPILSPPPESIAKYHYTKGHVFPGMWDAHAHVLQYGEMLESVQLYGAESIEEVRSRIKLFLKENPGVGTKDRWIKGIGWDQAFFGGDMPTAQDLAEDPVLKTLYIFLARVDVHCTWVSPAVLSLLPSPPPDVPGGQVVRTPGLGVFCDNAMDMTTEHLPAVSRATKTTWLQLAQRELHKVGIVGVHDAGVLREEIALYDALADEGQLSLRIYAMLECAERNTFCPDDAVKISREDGLLSSRSVKLFADGALGSWGAAMLAPYADKPDTSGTMLIEPDALTKVTGQWSAAGWSVNIHAIGDRANAAAVAAIQSALSASCEASTDTPGAPILSPEGLVTCQAEQQEEKRFRIEHAQIIAPADQATIKTLGLIASIQPTHATSDMAYALSRLGSERLADSAYRMHSLGDLVILGSDFPVEPANPWHGVYAAATRRSPATTTTTTTTTTDESEAGAAEDDDGWYPEERLSLWQAVRGFAVAPARAAFLEHKTGGVVQGNWADWVVVKEDLMHGEGDSGRGVTVLETWVAGKRVYQREP